MGGEALINAMTFLNALYDALKSFLETLLASTIFKASPEIATTYSDATSLLVSLTAMYILLEVVQVGKRIIRAVLLLGWVLLMASLVLSAGTI